MIILKDSSKKSSMDKPWRLGGISGISASAWVTGSLLPVGEASGSLWGVSVPKDSLHPNSQKIVNMQFNNVSILMRFDIFTPKRGPFHLEAVHLWQAIHHR